MLKCREKIVHENIYTFFIIGKGGNKITDEIILTSYQCLTTEIHYFVNMDVVNQFYFSYGYALDVQSKILLPIVARIPTSFLFLSCMCSFKICCHKKCNWTNLSIIQNFIRNFIVVFYNHITSCGTIFQFTLFEKSLIQFLLRQQF